jgi:hypothetical protein
MPDASTSEWRSPAYKHYHITLTRDHEQKVITYHFHCIHNNPDHKVITRDRKKAGEGTHKLLTTAQACDEKQGIVNSARSELCGLTYDPIVHRTIVALRCAHSHRPCNSARDRFYKLEVELLRPGTHVPSPGNISLDIKRLYIGLAPNITNYILVGLYFHQVQFLTKVHSQGQRRVFHIVTDGWTNPQGISEQGLVIQWYAEGRIHRTTLEFIE